MSIERLNTISGIFDKTEDIDVIVPFKFCSNNVTQICGRICLTVEKEQLIFDVTIPIEYPLLNGPASTIFSCCDDIKGFLHQVDGNKICIVSPKTAILSEKLFSEINGLKEWMLKYYINEEEDEQYEYLIFKNFDKKIKTKLLFTSVPYSFQKNEFGTFRYTSLFTKSEPIPNPAIYETLIIQSIEKNNCQWANHLNSKNPHRNGLWLYIENEPVINPGVIVETWKDLEKYLSTEQIDFLSNKFQDKLLKSDKELLIILGYNISKNKEQEVHWQLIKVSSSNIPISRIRGKGNKVTRKSIRWSHTKNSSYNRFFGRGKLSGFLTEKRILIIGIGAIGSSLAISLVRGGLKNICLSDFDSIETGNICRSEYLLAQESLPKVFALSDLLSNISPFVNIDFSSPLSLGIPKIRPEQDKDFKYLKQKLSNYDIIFDCSTDMEIAYMLDKINLNSLVINLSISNGAKELVVVTGKDIAEDKARVFNDFDTDETLIYEGAGCAFPTFRASYIDINSLLNYTLKNLDYRFSKDIFNSFVVKTKETCNSIQFEIDEY